MSNKNSTRLTRTFLLVFMTLTTQSAWGQVYVFVSYSMSDAALQSYYREAQECKAQLVMRGLKNDSFLETKNKAEQLKIVYDINPELFDKYGISEVPVIVYDDGEGAVRRVTGHIPLSDAMRIMEQEE